MHFWIATALLTLASKAVVAMPSPIIPQPPPTYIDCEWVARVCWCTNINGYNEMVSDDFCFYIQDQDDWEANYIPRPVPSSPEYSDSEWSEWSEEEEEEEEDFSFWPQEISDDGSEED
ncbi:hypothetical protein CFIMG_006497RA [Ceratocystis fimbriata CBS 114723]|uniref:Uncharacterized protein n=1 Tax=Ceratocystis fimbriata CBS 114723 TaxID=1035309 RepID=A0A2C5WR02_9PEZI|nr:hypothetical protein CFIMG_006497RA [Ceratocystis fimbriata CBS 114723]